MRSRPTLSLLIPAHNAEAFLPRLLSSALSQTEPFDEIWVCDDFSSDSTAAIARNYGANVLRATENRGCSISKNLLAKHVSTEWLHFHDADDELLPNFVELARRWMSKDSNDVVLFNYEMRDHLTNAVLGIRRFDPVDLRKDSRSFAIREQINPFCGLYRRSKYLAVGGYDEDPAVLFNEDVAFHIRLAFADLSFDAESEVSIINYCRSDSMSGANRAKCFQAHFRVLEKLTNRTESPPYNREIAINLWSCAGRLGSVGDWDTARLATNLALKLSPLPKSAGSPAFRSVARISPGVALRARECLIRTLKPSLRRG